jgi:hypothetical protein
MVSIHFDTNIGELSGKVTDGKSPVVQKVNHER